MALIKSVKGKLPMFGKDVYLAENATVVGEVEMGKSSSVWFNAVVRGDVNSIQIGNKVMNPPGLAREDWKILTEFICFFLKNYF